MEHCGTRTLETARLVLRRFTPDDAQAMFDHWASDPQVTRYLTWPTHTSPEATRALLTGWAVEYENPQCYNWAMELREGGRLIGNISVVALDARVDAAELGYCMGSAWWGKGYMPEAAGAVARYLFAEVGANRVAAQHDVENPRSGRVMQKIGMRFEGVRRQGCRNNRGLVDLACYAMLAEDWRGMDRAGIERG